MISNVACTCFPVAALAVADAKRSTSSTFSSLYQMETPVLTHVSTLGTVVREVQDLPQDGMQDIAKAITHGSSMGARGTLVLLLRFFAYC